MDLDPYLSDAPKGFRVDRSIEGCVTIHHRPAAMGWINAVYTRSMNDQFRPELNRTQDSNQRILQLWAYESRENRFIRTKCHLGCLVQLDLSRV